MSSPPSLPLLLERYLATLEARGLAAQTVAHQRLYLGQLLAWLAARGIEDLRRVTPQVLESYRRAVAAHRYRASRAPRAPWRALTPQGRHTRLLAACRYLRFLVGERLLLADPSAALVIAPPPRSLPRRVLNESQVRRLLEATDTTPLGIRARAILELLYSSGLRRAEVAALDLQDLDLTGGTVLVRRGKGGKGRVVPLGATAARALLRYIEDVRPLWLESAATTALFLAASGCGRAGQRLSTSSIWLTVRHAAASSGLGRVATHALRHAVATHLVRAGADVRHVQEILGHSKVETTEIYTHVAVRDLARAHARSHPRGRVRSARGAPED